jgi:hypothetical protein
VIGAVLISATMLGLGSDAASLQTALREALAKGFDLEDASQSDELTRLVDMLVVVMPAAAAAAATLIGTLNLWLAGRVVRLSGRLSRPWPHLSAMRFPAFAPALLAAAVASSFLPGTPGLLARTLAAGLMMAHVLLGLAVIHAATIGLPWRPLILGSVYAAIAVSSWLVFWMLLFIGVIGITDTLYDLRGRIARMRES